MRRLSRPHATSEGMRCGLADYVTGDAALDALLREMAGKVADKAIMSGLRAGLSHVTKAIRGEIPQPSVRKAIGNKLKKYRSGTVVAKVGAGVGPRTRKELGPRGKRPGVGISGRNVHWYILGTKQRTQKKTGRRTGQMPANGAVRRGWAKSESTCMAAIQSKTSAVLTKEMAKLAKG